VSFNQPSGGKADVVPAVAMICVEGGGMASVALSGPSGGKATDRRIVLHDATAGQSTSGGSASSETASADVIIAASARR
jgi:hypothetical protein